MSVTILVTSISTLWLNHTYTHTHTQDLHLQIGTSDAPNEELIFTVPYLLEGNNNRGNLMLCHVSCSQLYCEWQHSNMLTIQELSRKFWFYFFNKCGITLIMSFWENTRKRIPEKYQNTRERIKSPTYVTDR